MRGFRVILDACVLYPAPVRDLLMELALGGLYKAYWTDAIHDEWIAAVLRDRPDLTADKLTRTRELMDLHAEDALVSGFEPLLESLRLPDPNDRHVLAAAIHAKVDAIVTFNLKDFPDAALEPWGIEAIHPDDFVTYQFDLDIPRVCTAAKRIRARLRNPPATPEQYVERLHAVGLPRTSEKYRDCLALI